MGPVAQGLAGCAVRTDLHLTHSGLFQPDPVQQLQIHLIFRPYRVNRRFRRRAQRLAHGLGHIAVRLEATYADARANGRPDIAGRAAKFPLHGLHGFGCDAQRRAAPARMAGTHGPAHRVIQQNGRTVGAEHRERHVRFIGNQAVPAGGHRNHQSLPPLGLAHPLHAVGVDLLGKYHVPHGKAHCPAQNPVVFHDISRPVAPPVTQIQRGQVSLGYAAQPGGKAVGRSNARGGFVFQFAHANRFKRHRIPPVQ